MKQRFLILISVILALCSLTGCMKSPATPEKNIVSSASLPEFSGSAYIELNGNMPYFSLKNMANWTILIGARCALQT